MAGAHLVIGTAGHIDHGKTSMIRALTGVDLDTLPEEKNRGITIALGFAKLELNHNSRLTPGPPGSVGRDSSTGNLGFESASVALRPRNRSAAFVDVPGHERLVRTMIAGATGVDAVLLCVSAIDGVMPQTREHLSILGLLGVSEGAIVLTMADLVDPELLELAEMDVKELVEGTFLSDKPLVVFSATEGTGVEELKSIIGGFGTPTRALDGPFRLPVDRAFVQPGFGTVVTGTVLSGHVTDPNQVTLLPAGTMARVRGIEVHGSKSNEARAGWRVALNLAGVEQQAVPRGTVVVRGEVPCSQMLDVLYHHLPDEPPLDDGAPVRILTGTAECLGRIHAAVETSQFRPGSSCWAQIRLEEPLPCLHGDRFILRRTSPMVTLGGGEIIDPWAPRMRPKNRIDHGQQIERLHRGDPLIWLERAGAAGLSPAEWSQRTPDTTLGVILGDRILAPTTVGRLEGALLQELTEYHQNSPLSLGAHRRELRHGHLRRLTDKAFDALVDRLATTRAIEAKGALVRVVSFTVKLDEEQKALFGRLTHTIDTAGLQGVSIKALHQKHAEPEVAAMMRLVENQELASQIAGIGWISQQALSDLKTEIESWFAKNSTLTPGDFKALTGLSRKNAIPLLEWLDKSRITERHGDSRIAGSTLRR
ncbi:MAG: selenocysteine-specific translation elongation factor [Proteobacteria bacterium]|jgi:selenocysteine-specific elongation factor|nr:selenocysteine-specific translation elongation factor [Pseudomonadota bacterium]